jgi:hypothetical protein
MKLIKWIKKILGIKRKYVHTLEYKQKKVYKDAMIYGTGFMKVEWISPKKWYQFWR